MPKGVRRIKFIWGSCDAIKGRWHLGLIGIYAHRPGYPGTGLAISLRGLLRWGVVLAVVGYTASVALVIRSLRGLPKGEVTWVDAAAWPLRRARLRDLRGRAWIAQGQAAIQAGRFGEGAFLLRSGLGLDPRDAAARLELAQVWVSFGARPRALGLLAEAPIYGLPDRAWRQDALAIAADGEEWNFTLTFVDACLPRLAVSAFEERGELLAAKARALIGLGRAADALALTAAPDLQTEVVRAQHVEALLALDRVSEAVDYLAAWRREEQPAALPPILRLQAQALRRAGRFAEFEQTLEALRALHPAMPQPAAFGVAERARAGRGAAEALADYLLRFGGRPANLRLVASELAQVPDVPLLSRIVAAARERGYPLRPALVALAEGLLRQGDWAGLAPVVAELEPLFSRRGTAGWIWFVWMNALSHALVSTEAGMQQQLVNVATDRTLSLEAYKQTVAALRRAGRVETAGRMLAAARLEFAESPWLLAQTAEVNRELAARAPKTPAPALAARPVPVVQRQLFDRLDAAMSAGHWPEARALVQKMRRLDPRPPWLIARETDLLRRELRIDQGLGDVLALRLSAQLLLGHGAERIDELLEIARDFAAHGDRADAVLIATLVREKYPGNVPAAQLLEDWQPHPKAAAP